MSKKWKMRCAIQTACRTIWEAHQWFNACIVLVRCHASCIPVGHLLSCLWMTREHLLANWFVHFLFLFLKMATVICWLNVSLMSGDQPSLRLTSQCWQDCNIWTVFWNFLWKWGSNTVCNNLLKSKRMSCCKSNFCWPSKCKHERESSNQGASWCCTFSGGCTCAAHWCCCHWQEEIMILNVCVGIRSTCPLPATSSD